MMRPKNPEAPEEAEVMALQALGFLAADPERFQRFLDLSGLSVGAIRAGAGNPAFLGGILDHLLEDQPLLLIFSEERGLRPDHIAELRRKLPGAAIDF